MLDPNKMQYLANLVQASSILTAAEKAEWLSLMSLMDDKQLGELEDILKPSSEQQKPETPSSLPAQNFTPNQQAQVTNQNTKPMSSPSLSHISNLPSELVDPRLEKSVLNKSSDNLINSSPSLYAKQVLSPPATTTLPKNPEASFGNQSLSNTVNPQQNHHSLAVNSSPQPISTNASRKSTTSSLTFATASDIGKLTSEVLHHQNRSNFYQAIMALAEKVGYFQVVSQLEESPLYADYLNYGRAKLAGKQDGLSLSQEEFEFVADVLSSLKVNRV